MGGGVSLPAVPLSGAAQQALKDRYAKLSAEGKSDADISSAMAASLGGVVVFDQVDCDHTGSVSQKELKRLLKALPRKKPVPPEGGWPDGQAPKFVPFEGIVDTLDSDGDGEVSLDEWLANLDKLPGLKAAINGAVDPSTGKIAQYQSLEARLDELVQKAAPLEASHKAAGDGATGGEAPPPPPEELLKLRKQIAKLRETVGSAGVAVFRQFDLDGSGKIDRAELLAALKALPRPKMGEGEPKAKRMSMDEIVGALDVDGDGVIDMDEWVAQLERLPSLKASIEQAVDPSTGKVKGYAGAAGASVSKVDLIDRFRTSAWDGTWVQDAAEGATFFHGGQEMPIGAFLGWCSAVGAAGCFPAWKWTNCSVEEQTDGRVKVGSQQTTGKLAADIPAIGPFPEVKLADVPADSLLLSETGAILPVEIGYYTFDDAMKVTKIEYTGEIDEQVEGVNTLSFTPNVGPPLLYAMAGKPLGPPLK